MKKIMVVTGSLGAGGIEKVTSLIADHFIAKGYEVSICCLLQTQENTFSPPRKDVRVFYFNASKGLDRPKILISGDWIKFLKETFEEEKPDCVLAMTLKIGALCSIARKNKPIRLSFRETSDPFSKVRNRPLDRLLCLICRKIDGIIFQTEWERKCYPKYMQRKGKVIPNPISVDAMWDKNAIEKTIVSLGRLTNIQKRHDILIQAFALFIKDNPGYELKIYGNGEDKEEDEKLIKSLGIEPFVKIIDAKKNIHSLISNVSMFVITSDFEGLSNALAEAMIMGIPCISSDWPGSEDVITHNVNGYVYKRQNVAELASYMNNLANDDEKKVEFSVRAQSLQRHFDPKIVMEDYSKIIEG